MWQKSFGTLNKHIGFIKKSKSKVKYNYCNYWNNPLLVIDYVGSLESWVPLWLDLSLVQGFPCVTILTIDSRNYFGFGHFCILFVAKSPGGRRRKRQWFHFCFVRDRNPDKDEGLKKICHWPHEPSFLSSNSTQFSPNLPLKISGVWCVESFNLRCWNGTWNSLQCPTGAPLIPSYAIAQEFEGQLDLPTWQVVQFVVSHGALVLKNFKSH